MSLFISCQSSLPFESRRAGNLSVLLNSPPPPSEISLPPGRGPGPVFTESMDFFFFFGYFCPVAFSAASLFVGVLNLALICFSGWLVSLAPCRHVWGIFFFNVSWVCVCLSRSVPLHGSLLKPLSGGHTLQVALHRSSKLPLSQETSLLDPLSVSSRCI